MKRLLKAFSGGSTGSAKKDSTKKSGDKDKDKKADKKKDKKGGDVGVHSSSLTAEDFVFHRVNYH